MFFLSSTFSLARLRCSLRQFTTAFFLTRTTCRSIFLRGPQRYARIIFPEDILFPRSLSLSLSSSFRRNFDRIDFGLSSYLRRRWTRSVVNSFRRRSGNRENTFYDSRAPTESLSLCFFPLLSVNTGKSEVLVRTVFTFLITKRPARACAYACIRVYCVFPTRKGGN